MEVKKVSPQSIIGQQGANLIEKLVLQMGFVWRQLLIFDVGIDGEIEIRDSATGQATNTIIRVQSKATTQSFQSETDKSFEYTCEARDLDYWLRGNVPVILVVCRPSSDEAYWIPIREYFKDLASQKNRKIYFDKQLHAFNRLSADSLKQIALLKNSGIYFAPLQKSETLYSNLLKVEKLADTIYIAPTELRESAEVWGKLNSVQATAGSEWILTNKQIISFHNLEEKPYSLVCDADSCEKFNVTEWSNTADPDKKRDFVKLLNQCLKERNKLIGLKYDKKQKIYFFPATPKLKTKNLGYQSITKRASREVFKQYNKKSDPNQRAYCRHSAFKGYFQRVSRDWYLEITPTYHFTSNGYLEDMFRAEHIQGIKRLERNPAVFGQLLMWADFIGRPVKTLFSSEYPFISFGKLASVDILISIPDDIWYFAEEELEKESMKSYENQPDLFGL